MNDLPRRDDLAWLRALLSRGPVMAVAIALSLCLSLTAAATAAGGEAAAGEGGTEVTEAVAFTAAEIAELAAQFDVAEDDAETILHIIHEGISNNRTMEHLTYLSEEIGARLTGSSNVERANHWAAKQFKSFGLKNVHQHMWGTIPVRFDRGPSTGRMVAPIERGFEFTARAWSAGTDGPVRGRLFREPMTDEEFEAIEEELEGAWILRQATTGHRRGVVPGIDEPRAFLPQLREAGIAGLIVSSRDDLVRTGRVRNWRELDYNDLPTEVTVIVRRSDYDAMNSRLADGEEIEVEFDLDHRFTEGPIANYNTIAEIPGSVWPDEVVIVSGHLDSWDGPGSQGTTDNGTGSSVTIEAARILAAVDVQPKRTIRFILWTGEEQGLLGSRAYVQELSEEERARISAVLVDDTGTNRQAALSCVEEMVPMLTWALEPANYAFPDMPVTARVVESMRRGRGGSDHAPFNRAGIPGFLWNKEGSANYWYGWHTQNDRLDLAVPEYLTQSSTVSALTAFMLANADGLLPREPQEVEEEEQQRSQEQPAAEAETQAEPNSVTAEASAAGAT